MYKNSNPYLKIKSRFKYIVFLCAYFLLFIIAKLLYGRTSNWLICERGDEAQDNGFIFFKYLVEKHPQIRPVYAIKRNSSDFKKVSKIGKTVEFGSFKHFLYVIGFPVKISTHLFGYSPWVSMTTYYRRNRTKDKHVFLQHGIIKNYHPGLCGNSCKSLDLFICGARPEYEYIREKFEYDKEVPQYTGLPRFDLLNNSNIHNQIIIMPTWRANFVGLSDEEFMNTSFFIHWKSFINSSELHFLAKRYAFKIKFYLHSSFKKFTHLFSDIDNVDVLNYKDETVQNLIKNSKLLITDYSSVYFDFAYLHKPVIYYQFDEDDYYKNHYAKGYFDYRLNGFGDVCVSQDDTLKSVADCVARDFTNIKKYEDRIVDFFEYHDSNNCDRVYEAIWRVLSAK